MRSFKISVVKILMVMVAMLMLGTNLFAQISVTLPDVLNTTGNEETGVITVDDLTGENVTAFQFSIFYDADVVYITDVNGDGTLIDGLGILSVNYDNMASGQITVAWASPDPLSGSGALLNLVFQFRNAGVSTLDFQGTFLFNEGTPARTEVIGSATTAAILIQGGAVGAVDGDDLMIPIYTSELVTADNIVAYTFTATYDPTVINLTGYELAGTLSADGTPSINFNNTTGTVTFAWSNFSNITGSGLLLYLTGTAVGVGTSDFDFTSFVFNEGTPTASYEPGQVVVTEANVAPTLALNPTSPYSVNEGTNIQIQLVGADANTSDVLTYSATGLPSGASLNSTTGLFSWTPAYNQANTYTVTFKVTDAGGLFDTEEAVITVNNVNRAPVFTTVLPPGVVVKAHYAPTPVYYQFLYTANDPDVDPLTFSLEAGPDGSSISANGVFSWNAKPSQAGQSFVVTVKVTDGSLTTYTSETISVHPIVDGVEDEFSGIPTEFKLLQNYPNPFNPSTSIRFGLPKESHVKLSVYNVLGQEVGVLIDQTMGAGFHKVDFDASKLNTGMYIYKIEADNFVSVKKMLFVK
ncbi:MAG: putative Ig domain-containing protein [Elusimicrobiota bacterium]